MKVSVVHSFYRSAEPSGENETVLSQVDALRSAGLKVQLVSRSTDEESGAPLYRLSAAAAAAGFHRPNPMREIGAFDPDIIHIHNLFPNFGTGWAGSVPSPIIATAHNYRSVCSNGLLYRDGKTCTECLTCGSQRALAYSCYRGSVLATAPLAWATRNGGRSNAVLNACSRLITLNPYASAIFSRIVGPSRVVELPNFVEQAPVIGRRGDNVDREGYVYVGRLTPEKGVEWLLRNWPEEKRLTIAGAGTLEPMVQAISRRIRNIEFRGKLNRNEVADLISKAAALVLPSLWLEGLPTVALEAFSEGTPLLVSSKLGAAEQLTRDGAGVIFNPDDGKPALVAAIQEVECRAAQRREAAIHQYQSFYSRDRWTEEITALYQAAISEARRRVR